MCNLFKKNKSDVEDLAELKAKYQELLEYVKCLKLSDLGDVSGALDPAVGDTLTFTGKVWNNVKGKYSVPQTEPSEPSEAQNVVVTLPETSIRSQELPNYGSVLGYTVGTISVNDEDFDIKQLAPVVFKGNWDELDELISANSLIPGAFYVHNAYGDHLDSGHYFDLMLLATSKNTFSLKVYAIPHEGETYNYGNMSQWDLKYDIESDNITYMKDEWGNEANYDFKNTLIKDGNLRKYTFDYNGTDGSRLGAAQDNLILNKRTIFKVSKDASGIRTVGNKIYYKSTSNSTATIKIGVGSSYNTIYAAYAQIGQSSSYNTISAEANSSRIENNCSYNDIRSTTVLPNNVRYFISPIVKYLDIIPGDEQYSTDPMLTIYLLSNVSTAIKWEWSPQESQDSDWGNIQLEANSPLVRSIELRGLPDDIGDFDSKDFQITVEYIDLTGKKVYINVG